MYTLNLDKQSVIRSFEESHCKETGEIPEMKPGDTVRLKINIYEGGSDQAAGLKKIQRIAAKGKKRTDTKVERVQLFEGVVIGIQGTGLRQKITVRKLASGVGVEKTYFTNSRKVAGIEIIRRAHVRRAKLYYLRDRVGKATRLRERRMHQPGAKAAGGTSEK